MSTEGNAGAASTPGASTLAAQPTDMTEAQRQHMKLMAEQPDLKKAYLAGDPAALAKISELYKNADVIDAVSTEAADRERALTEQRIESFLKVADLPPAGVEQMRAKTPVGPEERAAVERELGRMKKDKALVRAYLDGDRAAVTRFTLANIVLGSPVRRA